MKKILLALATLCILSSCETFKKSEESIILRINTASILKGRTIDSQVKINNADDTGLIR